MIKGIFWDNDGILVDTEPLYFRASKEVLARYGVELTQQQFIDISLKDGRSLFSLVADDLTTTELDAARQSRDERYAELLQGETSIIPGVEETLAALHGRVSMAIVTSSRPEHFALIHDRSGLLKYFDFVLTRDDYVSSKPHPEPYLTALRKSGLRPEDCRVIEDSERGLLAACRAGLHCLVIPGKLTRTGDFSSAERVLTDIREVPAALQGLPPG
jgi:HAD superfamily hydrolase (TIGR01509 family)